MNSWFVWIPKPNAWMSAILLFLLMRGLAVVIGFIRVLGSSLIGISPKWGSLLYLLALLSPILVVAVAHQWLHLFLDRFFPNTTAPEMRGDQGLFPGLMSWWEGFYGWLAIALAYLVSNMLMILFLPSYSSLYSLLAWWDNILKSLLTVETLIWLLTAAYLYQFEHLVRNHLMSVGAANQSNQQS